jgi:hypothetical protein
MVNVFNGQGNRHAFTDSSDAAVLPPEHGPWTYSKSLDMNRGEEPRIGVPSDDVLDAIESGKTYLIEEKAQVTQKTTVPRS